MRVDTKLGVVLALGVGFGLGGESARAQGQTQTAADEVEDSAEAQPEVFQAVVRGLYVETKVGGGIVLLNESLEDLPPDPFNPQISGQENLRGVAGLGLAVGYDLNDFFAIQLLGGTVLASGTRTTRVRDVGFLYGGGGVRLSFGPTERLRFFVSPGAVFVASDNQVDEEDSGPGALVSGGLEYNVHVRHFSVGLELQAFVPLQPFRAMLSLAPTLKYTF